jgi:hypothetical protein
MRVGHEFRGGESLVAEDIATRADHDPGENAADLPGPYYLNVSIMRE